jgi:hypothetical protein
MRGKEAKRKWRQKGIEKKERERDREREREKGRQRVR